jgi:hypothetical protein
VPQVEARVVHPQNHLKGADGIRDSGEFALLLLPEFGLDVVDTGPELLKLECVIEAFLVGAHELVSVLRMYSTVLAMSLIASRRSGRWPDSWRVIERRSSISVQRH